MKFNRSHILIISLISIFLLLSVGAASAASDLDDIASDVAIDDITEIEDIDNNAKDIEVLSQVEEKSISDEVILGEDEGEGGDEPVSDSINTTIESNNETYSFGDTIKINFTLKDNETNNITNVNASNLKVYYKNETDEVFNKTVGFSINNESQLVLKQMPVGYYLLNIRFLNSTIDGKNYTESNTTVSLNITKTDTRFNATEAKVKVTDDIIIPFKIYIEANKTLNVNVTSLNVTYGEEEIAFTNTTGGNNVTNGIKLTNFTKGVGQYGIRIRYLGNDNCNSSETTVNLYILENNTIKITDNITFNNETNNWTIPISVSDNVSTLNISSDNVSLVLVYNNGSGYTTLNLTSGSFGFTGENGAYNISYGNESIPFNDVKLTIIYAKGTLNETNTTIVFIENNTIVTDGTIKFNNHTHNVTIPISINHTDKVTYDLNGNSTTTADDIILNITAGDITLILYYFDEAENKTLNKTISTFDFSGENGTYNASFIEDDVPLENATVTIIYANGTLNETSKNVTLKGVIELAIIPVNVSADYQDGEFVFKVVDSFDNSIMNNTNITASGLWFYTFGNSSSLSGSKVFTTDAEGFLRIKNENLSPNLDISGYSAGFVSLPVGTYNITFRANDPLVLNNASEIKVNKVQAKIVASNLASEFGNIVKYTYQIVNSKTNEPIKVIAAIFRIVGGNLDATRSGPTNLTGFYTSPSLNLTANKYTLVLSTNDSNLICSSVNKTLTITKRLATLTSSSKTVYYGATDDVVVTIKDKKTGKILANTYVLMTIYTTAKKSITYAVMTNKKGVATFSPPTALTVGKHKVILSVMDNNYNSSSITRYVTVKKASAKFTASNIKTYYRSGRIYKVKLTNKVTKKGLYGAKLNIKIYISKNKYYNYNGTTSKTGLVQLKVGYNPGTYKVVVSSADKGYSAKKITRTIKVTKHPIRFKPVSLKVKKGKNLKVKVISKKTKKGLSSVKVKIKVYTGKKYKTYTRKANKKGFVYLKIKQKVGKHKIIISPKSTKLYSAKKLKKTLRVKRK